MFSMLRECPYGDSEEDIGVEDLIYQGIFIDAYPLHEGKGQSFSSKLE